jgi:hypothetical protein
MKDHMKNLLRRLGWGGKSDRTRDFLLELLPKRSVGAEIGVHEGDFSEQVLAQVHPRKLHLIDPWKHEVEEKYRGAMYGGLAEEGQREMDKRYEGVCRRFREEISAGVVSTHRGYSSDVFDQFADGTFDWVYVDGNHLYEFVKQDLELYFPKTKAGGYLAGDDYALAGWWEDGVTKAVDEFAKKNAVEVVALRNHQFVLRKTG